jgi:redox-sensitive bicupin YhaK (pirin superfamily)
LRVINDDRYAWVQVVGGAVQANGEDLGPGDGLAISGASALDVEGREDAEVLVFDLA